MDAAAAFLASLEEPKLTSLAEAGKKPPIEILPPGMPSLTGPMTVKKSPAPAAQSSEQQSSKPMQLEAPPTVTATPTNVAPTMETPTPTNAAETTTIVQPQKESCEAASVDKPTVSSSETNQDQVAPGENTTETSTIDVAASEQSNVTASEASDAITSESSNVASLETSAQVPEIPSTVPAGHSFA